MKFDVKKYFLASVAASVISSSVFAAGDFKIERISYRGLKRISSSTVSNYLHVRRGQIMTSAKSAQTIKSLYKTGFFQAVELDRQGNTLVVRVVERGTIGSITMKGNKSISSDQLKAVLKQLGVTKGNVFQRSAIERFKQQLKQEYNMRGKYNARIITRTTPLTQNRIAVAIEISEGRVARIKKINFIGNHALSDSDLKSMMLLSERGFLTYFTKKDQYNQAVLEQSLQLIRDYYMDHGYLKFKISSSQVLLAANKKSVYVNIKVSEGAQYHFSGFDIAGKTILSKHKLLELVDIKKGNIFSRKKITDSIKAIGEALGDNGYGFPSINAEPQVNETKKTIFITLMVQQGRHVYVRRINFKGNTKTGDYVLRQAIKQNEGAILSLSDVKESERQLRILGYLKNVKVQTVPVKTANNQVDINFEVEEAPSAEASLSLGYGTNGPELNASFNQHNFMGTGRTAGFNFNTSYWGRSYGLNYYDPFYSATGMGRGFNIYYQTVDPKKLDISSYTSDKFGFNINYNILIGDTASIQFGYGLERLSLSSLGSNPATQLQSFVNTYGTKFDELKLTAGWHNNSYDQQPFARRGINQQLNILVALPVSSGSLKYYKATYQAHGYLPIVNSGFILTALGNVAYGNMFNRKGLPFYENYFAGGIAQPGQVRGYESYSLGPLDSNANNIGGNFLINGSLGLVLPHPLSQDSIRTTVFMDFGNVYSRGVSAAMSGTSSGSLRYSAGVAVDWRSPFGPLSFSLAKPVRKQPGDQANMFQFTVMSGF